MSGAAPVSRRRVLGVAALALAMATVALVTFVLPAEYGVDPLGTGRALGLLALAEPERRAVEDQSSAYSDDVAAFELQPFESVEYKYRLEEGDALVFAWRSGADVVAELHAEPDDAPEGFAERFDRRRSAGAHGSFRAPFSGWHGWFWENRSPDPVTVTLDAAGFFSAARTYRGGRVWEEPKRPAPADAVSAARPE